jgi:Domain of unknown function (DUF4062)
VDGSERKNRIAAVFISSTVRDLELYRRSADFAAHRARFHVLAQEYFLASGDKRPLDKCLEEVSKADVPGDHRCPLLWLGASWPARW